MCDLGLIEALGHIDANWTAAIAGIVSAVGAVTAVIVIYFQLNKMASDRLDESHVAVVEQIVSHNARMLDEPIRREALRIFMRDGLHPPGSSDKVWSDYELYWATRDLHLSHQNILASAWNLGGRRPMMTPRFWGLENLRMSLRKELESPPEKPEGYRQACSDIWNALKTGKDPSEAKFFEWLSYRDSHMPDSSRLPNQGTTKNELGH